MKTTNKNNKKQKKRKENKRDKKNNKNKTVTACKTQHYNKKEKKGKVLVAEFRWSSVVSNCSSKSQ